MKFRKKPHIGVKWDYDKIGGCCDFASWLSHGWVIPLNAEGLFEHGWRLFGICRIFTRERTKSDGILI